MLYLINSAIPWNFKSFLLAISMQQIINFLLLNRINLNDTTCNFSCIIIYLSLTSLLTNYTGCIWNASNLEGWRVKGWKSKECIWKWANIPENYLLHRISTTRYKMFSQCYYQLSLGVYVLAAQACCKVAFIGLFLR